MNKAKLYLSMAFCIIVGIAVIAGAFIAIPYYNVWQQEMSGRAEFAKAEQNRKIKIEEAKANLEAEKLNAQAEIEACQGSRRSHKNRKRQPHPYLYPISLGKAAERPQRQDCNIRSHRIQSAHSRVGASCTLTTALHSKARNV